MNFDSIDLNICLTDLDKSLFYKSEKTGKFYLNLTIKPRKEPDRYNNDLTLSYKKKNKTDETKYLQGSTGKTFILKKYVENKPVNNSNSNNDDDDFMF